MSGARSTSTSVPDRRHVPAHASARMPSVSGTRFPVPPGCPVPASHTGCVAESRSRSPPADTRSCSAGNFRHQHRDSRFPATALFVWRKPRSKSVYPYRQSISYSFGCLSNRLSVHSINRSFQSVSRAASHLFIRLTIRPFIRTV